MVQSNHSSWPQYKDQQYTKIRSDFIMFLRGLFSSVSKTLNYDSSDGPICFCDWWSLYWGQELWLDCTIYELLFFASEVIWNAAAKSSSIQFIRSVVSDSLQPHKSQNTRTPCSSRTPRVHSNSCPSSQWCHPAISSSVTPFSSWPQSLLAS